MQKVMTVRRQGNGSGKILRKKYSQCQSSSIQYSTFTCPILGQVKHLRGAGNFCGSSIGKSARSTVRRRIVCSAIGSGACSSGNRLPHGCSLVGVSIKAAVSCVQGPCEIADPGTLTTWPHLAQELLILVRFASSPVKVRMGESTADGKHGVSIAC